MKTEDVKNIGQMTGGMGPQRSVRWDRTGQDRTEIWKLPCLRGIIRNLWATLGAASDAVAP